VDNDPDIVETELFGTKLQVRRARMEMHTGDAMTPVVLLTAHEWDAFRARLTNAEAALATIRDRCPWCHRREPVDGAGRHYVPGDTLSTRMYCQQPEAREALAALAQHDAGGEVRGG
jgi:hypothetical protein